MAALPALKRSPPLDDALRARLSEIASRITRSGGWIYDVVGDTVIWSDAMCALHEVPVGSAPAPSEVFDFNPPEFHDVIRKRIGECIRHGVSFDEELQIITASGKRVWVRCLGDAVRDARGRTLMIEGALQDISEKKAYEQTIRDNEERFINVAHATTDAVWDWDLEGDTIWWNDGAQKVFGFPPEQTARDSDAWLARLHPDDRDRVQQKIVDAIKGESDNWSDTYQSQCSDGSYKYVSDHALLVRREDGRVKRMVGGVTDLSSRKQLERDLERLNRALRMLTACNELLIRASDEHDLLTAVCELIVTIGGYKMAYVAFAVQDERRSILPVAHAGDPAYLASLALSWSEHLPLGRGPAGRTIRSGAATFVNDILIDPLFAPWRENAARHGFRAYVSLPLLDHSGTFGLLALFSEKVLAVGTEEIRLLQQMANDIAFGIGNLRAQTAQRAAAQEIEQLAFYDQLTQLPNRQLLVERLRHSQSRTARTGMIGALLFIDLDNFKTLNDTLGHARGDQLLQVVSARLSGCVREHDTVARFGGDEFVISLVDLDLDTEAAHDKALTVADKILDAMRQPILLDDHEHQGSCSIGITLFDQKEDTIDDLLKRADLAMYRAKAAGRNAARMFTPDMQTAVNARVEAEADLRRAVAQEEFILHYQPQIDLQGRVTGAEALVRWQHPQRGMVSPLEFIFLAEETGLIHALGRLVLESACRQFAKWSTLFSKSVGAPAADSVGKTDAIAAVSLVLAVNVSVQQFRHPDFVDLVLAVVASSGIDPRCLKLELTESLLVDDVEATIARMSALKARGIAFALDDFGTGYSSLSYLKRLPLDELKIDQSFVRDVLSDPNDAAIARTIVALANSLGLSVIAEGVETAAQRDFLAQNGCTAYQGYFISRPLPAAGFEQFVLDNLKARDGA
jgi:diguanylate cyclase (GGDEF)-like protein/PAS domain S-box-containing protein